MLLQPNQVNASSWSENRFSNISDLCFIRRLPSLNEIERESFFSLPLPHFGWLQVWPNPWLSSRHVLPSLKHAHIRSPGPLRPGHRSEAATNLGLATPFLLPLQMTAGATTNPGRTTGVVDTPSFPRSWWAPCQPSLYRYTLSLMTSPGPPRSAIARGLSEILHFSDWQSLRSPSWPPPRSPSNERALWRLSGPLPLPSIFRCPASSGRPQNFHAQPTTLLIFSFIFSSCLWCLGFLLT